jgi:hypothetical protein
MKLTNYVRDGFINAVMLDVPTIDYEEQIRKVVLQDFVDRLPPQVRALWDNPDMRGWITTSYRSYGNMSATFPVINSGRNLSDCNLSVHATKAVAALVERQREQSEHLKLLQANLKATVYGCSTRKQLAERLPEFAKYLPRDSETCNTLPAVANVVAEFVKAGWPKDEQPVAGA